MSHYGSAEGMIEYLESRGRELPDTVDQDAIESSLLVASEWLDGVYGSQFSGDKTDGYTQEREWPRMGAYATTNTREYIFNDDVIPDRVINATYEAAYRQAITPGSLMVDYTPGKYKRVSIDGALSVEYAGFNQASDIQTQFGAIDLILAPLLNATGAGFSPLTGDAVRV